jgi:hypothetical protein
VALGKAFGRGYLFYFGLVFLFPLFILILGVGSSRFVGKITGPARP